MSAADKTGLAGTAGQSARATDGTFLDKALGWLGFLGAVAVTKYFGLGILLLAGVVVCLVLALAWGIGRVTAPKAKPMAPALGAQAAQLVWVLGAASYAGLLRQNTMDAAMLTAGLVWLWLRPGRVIVALLCILQGFFFYSQLADFILLRGSLGAPHHTELLGGFVLMTLLRVCAIGLMVRGLFAVRRDPPPAGPPTPPGEVTP